MVSFVDQVTLHLRAGDGGDGCVSVKREKFKPLAGPDGADGGKGGSMHLAAPDRGHLLSSGVVATQIPVAVGAAFANARLKTGQLLRRLVRIGNGHYERLGLAIRNEH